ncbi:jg25895, partial [Pararge aegeria aegeria]
MQIGASRFDDVKRTRPNTPSSASSDTDPSPNHHQPELSIKDMVLLIEEEGGLDDEELLEILTCPSPVWWEDPPNGYIEDPIFSRSKPAEQKSIKSQLLEEESKEAERRKQRDKELESKDPENLDVSKLAINVENRGINFVNRRRKLESLLGNIRNRIKSDSDGNNGDKNMTNRLNDRNIDKRGKTDDSNTILNLESKAKEVKRNTDKALNTNKKNNSHTNKNQGGLKPKYRKRKVLDSKKDSTAPKTKITKNSRKIRRSKRKTAVIKLEFDLKHDDKFEGSRNITTNVETKSTNSMNNCDENNTPYTNNLQDHNKHLKKRNKESCSSNESLEEDHLIDLEDHELLSLENIEIPIAPKIRNPKYKIVKRVGVKLKKRMKCEETATDKSSNKINNTALNCNLVNKPSCNNQNEVVCTKKEIEKSDEIPEYCDDTSPDKSTHNRVKKIDTTPRQITNKSKVDISLTNIKSDISLDKIAPTNIKKIRAIKKRPLNKRNKNDGLKNTPSIKVVIPSSFSKDDVRQSVKREMSHFLSDIKKVCKLKNKDTTVIETKDIESCINNSKTTKKDLCAKAVDEIPSAEANKVANELDDFNKTINNSVPNENILSYNITKNDSTLNQITVNCEKGNKTDIISDTKGEIDNARRYSIDSAFSDKNMSVEYLDMSLLDEDEHKVEPLSNEVKSECDDKTQDEEPGINKNSQIDIRSEPELYDQFNESGNNDIIQYIRRNNKDIDKEIINNESFNAGCTMSRNFRSSSPIKPTKKSPNVWAPEKDNLDNDKQSEYIAVYKIINNDSDIESNLLKTSGVQAYENNDVHSIKVIKTEDSYDAEYLSEFYEEDNEGNTSVKLDNEINLINLNKVQKIPGKINNSENLIKPNEVADTASKCNEGILVNPDASKINNYFQQRKQVRKKNSRSNTPCNDKYSEGKLRQ